MSDDGKRYLLAIATMVSTIVGVGIFGVPQAISSVGILVAGGYFLGLTLILILQGLFYAEAAIATTDKVRFPGLVRMFVGPRARHVAAVTSVLGFWGGMVAYVLVGGSFLHLLLSPFLGGTEWVYRLAWAIISAFMVYRGLEFMARFDVIATIAIVAAGLIIIGFSIPHASWENVSLFTGKDLLLPYGVILFSLSGLPAIPEMEDILNGRHRHFRQSVVIGTLIAAALTAAFGFTVYAVTGSATTEDSVSGLHGVVGGVITTIAAVFGFFAVATSYLTSGMNVKEIFEFDYRFRRPVAWLIATGVPVVIFLLGANSFVRIISFTGAVFYGIIATLVGMMYAHIVRRKTVAAPDKPLGIPTSIAWLTVAVLIFGAGYEFVNTIIGLF